jgi:hypothetical protein
VGPFRDVAGVVTVGVTVAVDATVTVDVFVWGVVVAEELFVTVGIAGDVLPQPLSKSRKMMLVRITR